MSARSKEHNLMVARTAMLDFRDVYKRFVVVEVLKGSCSRIYDSELLSLA